MELALIILIIVLIISLAIMSVYILALKLLNNSSVISVKIKKIKSVIYPIIIILTILIIWKSILPENYYSLKRLLGSNEKLFNKTLDKGSFNNEVDALVTYGSLNHDINVLYNAKLDENGNITELKEVLIKLKTESLVKIYDIKKSVKPYEGQGFIEIQIQNTNGSFVNGSRYWIEADYLNILTPSDLNKDKHLDTNIGIQKKNSSTTNSTQSFYQTSSEVSKICGPGIYTINLKPGEVSKIWYSIAACHRYTFERGKTCKFYLIYEDGTTFSSQSSGQWPDKYKFKIVNLATEKPKLVII
jgi:hypothetical protein